jgi:hypothetical protein
VQDIIREAGVTRSLSDARDLFFKNGGTVHNTRTDLAADDIIRRYAANETLKDIAASLDIDANAIRRVLTQHGVTLRTMTEAYGLMDREQSATRRAQGRSRLVGFGEEQVYQWLVERGETPDCQRPEGTRSLDLALLPVAVEIWLSATSPFTDPYCCTRIEYLSKRGLSSYYVWIARRTKVLLPIVADQIIAFMNFVRSQPPTFREHRVVRGCGELASAAGYDFNNMTLIPPSVDCPYHSCVNKSIAR